MAIIREILIQNFRSIQRLHWWPNEGLNCLIGHGDSGKSTILDAIDLTLGARRQFIFTDADFYLLDVSYPIDIRVTLGKLDDELKDIDYGLFHRGRNPQTGQIEPEPGLGLETVLTVALTVGADLEPFWRLYSERAEAQNAERNLIWRHRLQIAPTRLGTQAASHFAWGSRSVLNQLSVDRANASAALAAAARHARSAFAGEQHIGIDDVLQVVRGIANEIGVPVDSLQALLDVQGVSFSGGSVTLHDNRQIPLRLLGSGSSRLLVAGMIRTASATSSISLIDEVEHGLEPYRIVRLLDALGAKDSTGAQQIFMTTHSPVVLRELSAAQLHIVRVEDTPQGNDGTESEISTSTIAADAQNFLKHTHTIAVLGTQEDDQATLRACAEAFLAPSVIVCEGKTEIGLLRGYDLYHVDGGGRSMTSCGVHWADGGGDNTFRRALTFARLGYRTAIFRDGDKQIAAADRSEAQERGVRIFEWRPNKATENELFECAPADCMIPLIDYAVELRGADAIDTHIQKLSNNVFSLVSCRSEFDEAMRVPLGEAAKKYGWYKDIDPAEQLMRCIVSPRLDDCAEAFKNLFADMRTWIKPDLGNVE